MRNVLRSLPQQQSAAERSSSTFELVQVVYVGDGNNIVHSWIRLAAKFDFEFVCACPEGYEPDEATMELAKEAGGNVKVSYNPMEVSPLSSPVLSLSKQHWHSPVLRCSVKAAAPNCTCAIEVSQ